MTALKSSAAPPVFLAVTLLALWGMCLAGAYFLHGSSFQTTRAYDLGEFSLYALHLSRSLQQERADQVEHLASGRTQESAEELESSYAHTDDNLRYFRKFRGRFNSSDFSDTLPVALEEAEARLSRLSGIRSGALDGEQGGGSLIRFYSETIGALLATVYELEPLKLDDERSARLRDGYGRAVRLQELESREMAIGLALAAGMPLGPELAAEWQALSGRENASLAKSNSSLETLPRWQRKLSNWRASPLARKAEEMRARLDSGAGAGDPTLAAAWRETMRQRQAELFSLANDLRRQMLVRTSEIAEYAAYAFVLALLLAEAATLGVVYRYRPALVRPALLVLVLAFNALVAVWALTAGAEWVTHEAGPIESLQTLVVLCAFGLFCAEAAKHRGQTRPAAILLACVCLLIFFRELDLRIFDAPDWLVSDDLDRIRRTMFWIAFVLMAAYAAYSYRSLSSLVRPSLTWRAWPFYLWPALLVSAEGMEELVHQTLKDDLPGYWAVGQFWEEMLEFNAYAALLFAAWTFAEIYRRKGL